MNGTVFGGVKAGRSISPRKLLVCSVALSAMFASAASAQTAEPGSKPAAQSPDANGNADATIVVTGTSIRGVAPVGAPVIGFSQAEIQNQPAVTTTDLLRQMPSIVATGASEAYGGSANNANANITGGNGINLRGLGTEATLTLLNGRRLPPAGVQGQYFDPSVFATSVIGRLEVMPDGGSAIYGSDAVGGVVNVLTRLRFDGAEAYVKGGFGHQVGSAQAGLVAGKSWSSGNLLLAYEYFDRDDVKAADRPLYTDDLRAFGQSDLRLFTASPGNVQIGSTRYPIPAGQDGTSLASSSLVAATTTVPANRESVYKGASALPGQRRHSLFASLHQDLTPGLQAWTEGFYAHRKLDQTIGAATANLSVPQTNAFFVAPAGATLPLCAASVGAPAGTRCETVNYSFYNDFGPRVRDAFQEIYQVAAGLDADLGHGWKASAFASFGSDIEERTQYGINNPQLLAALRDTSRATAFNPFGANGGTNAATLAKIKGSQLVATQSDLTNVVAKIDGSLFALPGGDVKVAVGAEYQHHRFRYNTVDNFATPDTSTFTTVLAIPKRTVESGYAEVFLPLVSGQNARPGIEELSVSAALRHDHYSDFGGTTNPKFAIQFAPVKGLKLRGTYGKSFRAPTLSDMNPATLGVTVEDFADPTSPTGLTRTLFLRGGNTALGPEKATIWSLGADLAPAALRGLTVSLTYFNVDYTNRIEAPGNDRTALTAAREPRLGSLITRNPSATLVQSFLSLPQFTGVPENPANIKALVDGRKVNVGRLRTQGFEGNIQWSGELGPVTLNAGAVGNYFLNFKRAVLPTLPLVDVANTFGNPLKFRARGNLGVSNERMAVTGFVNFTGAYRNDTITPVQDVKAFATFDLSARYTWDQPMGLAKKLTLSIDVQNVFDRDPPIVPNVTPLAFDPQVASILGRFVTVGLRASW
ncbi:TonB-dependent receptor [Novosphingobium flavum]|nr:TonB-dependent receptor [Novosphingobium aerophilum]